MGNLHFNIGALQKKRGLMKKGVDGGWWLLKNKENPVCVLRKDSTLWSTFDISMHWTPIKRKGKEGRKKHSVYKLSELVQHDAMFWKINHLDVTNY